MNPVGPRPERNDRRAPSRGSTNRAIPADQGATSAWTGKAEMVDLTQPSEFLLQDVRCFRGEQTTRLRPITLLVGENSTGKTTYLGCYDVLHRLVSEPWSLGVDPLDFNREPFSMGSFRDIVRSQRGRAGRIEKFSLGFNISSPYRGRTPPYVVRVFFSEEGSQPVMSSVHYEFGKDSFLHMTRAENPEATVFKTPKFETKIDFPLNENWTPILDYFCTEGSGGIEGAQEIVDYFDEILSPYGNKKTKSGRFGGTWRQPFPQLIPVAPLRSKPKRTYDPIREIASPEGEHVPMLLMRLERTDESGWNTLHDDLVSFGKTSGLFTDISLKRHGRQMSDPFQLQVKVLSGSRANIMDVGYGVSQSLPILVDVNSAKDNTFLMQQPEVHLHPRAQAELSELVVNSFKRNKNRFLIETHSDYIIDRIRILARKRVLDPEDVSILYFAPRENAVEIHNIGLDEDGNLLNAPPDYRDFFVRESDRLLGFAD